MSEILSDHTLASWEKCFKQQIHSAMAPISPGTLLEWVAEIRRLREENAELKAAMGSGDDIMVDVICKCGASGLRPEKLLAIAYCTVCGRKMKKAA